MDVPRPLAAAIHSFFAVLATIACGCDHAAEKHGTTRDARTGAQKSSRPTIYTVNYPLKYFAERIGGDLIEVVFPVPVSKDPAYWRPDAATTAKFQSADLILLNGASFAKWIPSTSLPESRMVDTSAAFFDQIITSEDAVSHSHGEGPEHSHAGTASTTWIDPVLAAAHAEAIRVALVKILPQQAEILRDRYNALKHDLDALHARLTACMKNPEGKPLLFSHPVYQYLIQRYRLNAKSLHWEPDTMPEPDDWNRLAELLKTHQARSMVWEAIPNRESREKLAALGVLSIVFEPCFNLPQSGDYLGAMRRNLDQLEGAFAHRTKDQTED